MRTGRPNVALLPNSKSQERSRHRDQHAEQNRQNSVASSLKARGSALLQYQSGLPPSDPPHHARKRRNFSSGRASSTPRFARGAPAKLIASAVANRIVPTRRGITRSPPAESRYGGGQGYRQNRVTRGRRRVRGRTRSPSAESSYSVCQREGQNRVTPRRIRQRRPRPKNVFFFFIGGRSRAYRRPAGKRIYGACTIAPHPPAFALPVDVRGLRDWLGRTQASCGRVRPTLGAP